MDNDKNYFVKDNGEFILVRNLVYGFRELPKIRSPKETKVVIFQEGIGHQTLSVGRFDELKPESIFPEYG